MRGSVPVQPNNTCENSNIFPGCLDPRPSSVFGIKFPPMGEIFKIFLRNV